MCGIFGKAADASTGGVFSKLFRSAQSQVPQPQVQQSKETVDEGGMRARILQRRRAAALGGSRSTQNTGGAGAAVTGQSKTLLGL